MKDRSTPSRIQNSSSFFNTSKSTSQKPYDLSFVSPFTPSIKSRSKSVNSVATPESGSRSSSSRTMFVVALIDNRAREMGIAAMNLKSTELFLTQFTENSSSYNNLCNMIHIYEPIEIILPNTLAESKISTIILQAFQNSKVTHVARKFFNETKGKWCVFKTFLIATGCVLIKELMLPSYTAVEAELSSKYLCVSSASALLQYAEYIQSMTFVRQSLKVNNNNNNNINIYGLIKRLISFH